MPAQTGHMVPVAQPLGNGKFRLPLSTQILESQLPTYLTHSNVLTRADLEAINGLDITTVQNLIAAARADVLTTVNQML